jgi:ADP-ribose pyrophosphatase
MTTRPAKAPPVPPHSLYLPESDEVVWDGRFPVQRVRFRYRRRDGSLSGPLNWELWRRGQGVIILPWDPVTDRIAMIEQFRLPALAAGEDPIMTELPAGLLDSGEDPVACARRELEEETGLTCRRVERIGTFMTIPGGSDERIHCHVVQVSLDGVAGGSGGLASECEETVVVVLDAAEAFAMVADNRVRNAPAALSLLWLQVNHARLKAEWTE